MSVIIQFKNNEEKGKLNPIFKSGLLIQIFKTRELISLEEKFGRFGSNLSTGIQGIMNECLKNLLFTCDSYSPIQDAGETVPDSMDNASLRKSGLFVPDMVSVYYGNLETFSIYFGYKNLILGDIEYFEGFRFWFLRSLFENGFSVLRFEPFNKVVPALVEPYSSKYDKLVHLSYGPSEIEEMCLDVENSRLEFYSKYNEENKEEKA